MNQSQLKPYFNNTMKINKMYGKSVEPQEHTVLSAWRYLMLVGIQIYN